MIASSRLFYGILVLLSLSFLIYYVYQAFNSWNKRIIVGFIGYTIFSYWYVPILNYSAYTPVPIPYTAITLIKDAVWIIVLLALLCNQKNRIINIPKKILLAAFLLTIFIPVLLMNVPRETFNLIQSTLVYFPLIVIFGSEAWNTDKLYDFFVTTGLVLGLLSIIQYVFGPRTYLEIARGSYPRSTATLSGPTPLAIYLLFTILCSFALIYHYKSYRSYRNYAALTVIALGVLTTTAITPIIAMACTLSILLIISLLDENSYLTENLYLITIISTGVCVLVYMVPIFRYRLYGALGIQLDHHIALSTYRSRQARISDWMTSLNSIGDFTLIEWVRGSSSGELFIEIFYLQSLYNYGIIVTLGLIFILVWGLQFFFRMFSISNSRTRVTATIGFGFTLFFAGANVGSPVWNMYPSFIIFYMMIGIGISVVEYQQIL